MRPLGFILKLMVVPMTIVVPCVAFVVTFVACEFAMACYMGWLGGVKTWKQSVEDMADF